MASYPGQVLLIRGFGPYSESSSSEEEEEGKGRESSNEEEEMEQVEGGGVEGMLEVELREVTEEKDDMAGVGEDKMGV